MDKIRLTSAVAVLAGLLAVCSGTPDASGCFAVIVGREASADGSVLVGHNEQNNGQRVLYFRRVPRQRFDQGEVVRLRRGGRLPQVQETWALLWNEMPGLEFSDTHMNEWGVAITSDQCSTREDGYETLVARGEIRQGGIGHMFRRLVALRARSAREGVQLAGELIERFGYVDSGRTYVIADPREAWLLAVVRGRRWVAQRVPDDKVVLLPNIHIIGEVDLKDTDNFLASPDLIDYAARRGWFDPEGGRPFNFRRVYRLDRRDLPDMRRWLGRNLVSGKQVPWPPQQPPPIGVKPREKMTVAAVAAILRNTSGPGRPLTSLRTQECAVFQLRGGGGYARMPYPATARMPREIGCVYWRTTAEPSSSVLIPWYLGITEMPASYYRPVDLKTQLTLDHHFQPPRGTFDYDPKLAWWTFKRLQDVVREDYAGRIKEVRPVWAAFEDRVFRDQPAVEKKTLELWETDPDAARTYLTQYSAKLAAQARQQAEKLTERFAGVDRR